MRKRIKCGNYSAEISSLGADCLSFIYKDDLTDETAHIIREPKTASDETDFLFGIPLLFPPNRIKDGTFEFDGKQYRFPINDKINGCSLHGDLNIEEFSVVSENAENVALKLEKDYFGDVRQPYAITVEYSLSTDGLKQIVTVENRSDVVFPLAMGFHTSFSVPFLSGGSADEVIVIAEVEKEIERDERFLPTGRTFAVKNSQAVFPVNQAISKVFKTAACGKIRIIDTKKKAFVDYLPDEKFLYRVLFNGGSDEFICAEAQTCNINALKTQNESDGVISLVPFSRERFVSYIKFGTI